MLIKVFSPAYFAREDTRTPMRYAGISLTVNTLLSLALFFCFRALGMKPQLGIALATTLGGWLNTGLLVRTLLRRGHFVPDARLTRTLPRIVFSSVTMAVALYLGAELLEPLLLGDAGLWRRAIGLGALLAAGFLAYCVAVLGSGALEIRQLRRLVRRSGPQKGRRARGPPPAPRGPGSAFWRAAKPLPRGAEGDGSAISSVAFQSVTWHPRFPVICPARPQDSHRCLQPCGVHCPSSARPVARRVASAPVMAVGAIASEQCRRQSRSLRRARPQEQPMCRGNRR